MCSWVRTFLCATNVDKMHSCLKAHVFHVKLWWEPLETGLVITKCNLIHLYLPVSLILSHFQGQHLNLLEYHVPRSQGCLAELFRVLENHKAILQIKHYSISQTTLEEVFFYFYILFCFSSFSFLFFPLSSLTPPPFFFWRCCVL